MNTPSVPNMTSLPETTQKPPATETTLGHTSFNLTALEVVTALTILSLTYFIITCQLQKQLIWLHGVHSMNLLNRLGRHPLISLEPQNLRKKSKASRCKTNKIHLKEGKSLKDYQNKKDSTTPGQPQHDEQIEGVPEHKHEAKKPETPNQPLGTTTSNNHSNTIRSGICYTQIRSRSNTSRIYIPEYRTHYNHCGGP